MFGAQNEQTMAETGREVDCFEQQTVTELVVRCWSRDCWSHPK